MNVKGNAKSTSSKQRLQNALLTLLDQKAFHTITATELCALARVNRTTFYAHYLDVSDLMQKLEQRMVSQEGGALFDDNGDAYQIFNAEYLRAMLSYFRKNAVFYRYFFANSKENSYIIESSNRMRDLYIIPYIQKSYAPEETALQYEFCKSGFFGVVIKWLEQGCVEPDEVVSKLLETVLHKCMT